MRKYILFISPVEIQRFIDYKSKWMEADLVSLRQIISVFLSFIICLYNDLLTHQLLLRSYDLDLNTVDVTSHWTRLLSITCDVWRHHSYIIQSRLFQQYVHAVMVFSDGNQARRNLWSVPQQKRCGQRQHNDLQFMLNNIFKTYKGVIPDMQAITLQMPRAFMASRMFRVPSDIMVVGPTGQTFSYYLPIVS